MYKALQWYEHRFPFRATCDASKQIHSVRFFNFADWGGDALARAEEVNRPEHHYVIVGVGGLGQALVAQLTRRFRRHAGREAGKRIFFTLVDHNALEQAAQLVNDYPALVDTWHLSPQVVDVGSAAYAAANFLDLPGLPEHSKAFVCFADDGLNLLAGLGLRRALIERNRSMDVVLRVAKNEGLLLELPGKSRTSEDAGEGDAAPPPGNASLSMLKTFHIFDRVFEEDFEQKGLSEQIAIALHSAYCKSLDTTANPTPHTSPMKRPALTGWEVLPERYRESSRDQAESIQNALAQLDKPRRIVTRKPGQSPGHSAALSPEELEQLAEMEHGRWRSSKEADGWQYAKERDEIRKFHPNILAWPDLDSGTQNIDRDMIKKWMGVLEEVGLDIQQSL
ncbi:MAG: hypothetical protein HC888_07670 [Candidatus Competibacteraceae bacterium]|nr:hypothetical protein [Candidatus Competibacteraceae bacterium]